MPNAAPHPCARPGCRQVIPRGVRYCAQHAKVLRQADDARRGSAYSRGYDRGWQRVRNAYLAEHPLCECDECKSTGAVVAAEVVDHVQPIADRPDLRLDWSNLRAMSKQHHDRRTAREQAWGRGVSKLSTSTTETDAPGLFAHLQNGLNN